MLLEKNLVVRSSSAEFLIFERQSHSEGIQVRFEEGDLWLTQKGIADLYDVDRTVITKHLKNIYADLELEEKSTSAIFALVQKEGNREVERKVNYYNLDVVISVGYRVNSDRAIQFRRWATNVLKEFSKKGYIIDKKRMENGTFFDEDYFDSLLAEIREIRLSERRFYQKITDIYATSIDYDPKSPTTIKFFKKVQNKMHYAVSKQTAAEIIYNRADADKDNMGLTSWKNSPNGKILETDVVIAKNYLTKEEMDDLERIVSAFLDLAEARAKRNIPMTMEDWAKRIDKFLLADDRDILKDAGKISHEIACDKALCEYEKYRVKQDKLYKSDFDLLLEEMSKEEK
ncbi:MAG TPA: virulence RhuM family protein [Candidatus Onthousia excrementipullorum]|uniref:Virulence RhuM family protein n=1 Tax=Candidatus Onthousia excrementipullorum TaxID=2840884 RepID=A0A9D1DVS1_9FIRM|nr:virulence RhuM family protein [Candidatus Onthousia excrementipullorum]